MEREECKNCPLIEELRKLRAKIKELEKRLERYEKPEKYSGNSSLRHLRIKTKSIIRHEKKLVKKAGGQKGHKGSAKMLYDSSNLNQLLLQA